MNIRSLCVAVGVALQIRAIERHAARLLRDGLPPQAGDEANEVDAATLILAVAATPEPAEASTAIGNLMSQKLMYISREMGAGVVIQGIDADRSLMPETVVAALAEALEFESFGTVPGLRIRRLTVERGGLGSTIDVTMALPDGVMNFCAQYGTLDLLPTGLRAYAVVGNAALCAVASALHPSEHRQHCEPLPSLVMH